MPRKKDPNRIPQPPGRPRQYPWETWFNGEEHYLQRGVDFDYKFPCTTESMRSQLYAKARELGVKVTIRTKGDVNLSVRALPQVGRTGSSAKYDWDRLLDGETHTLTLGLDILSRASSFRVYARQVARDRGLRVTMRQIGRDIYLKAIPPQPAFDHGEPPL